MKEEIHNTNKAMDYPIAIVGAGIVGLAMACALSKLGINIALFDRSQPIMEWDDHQYDNRVSAITRSSQLFLQKCHVWQAICANRVAPYVSMEVWDGSGDGLIRFSSREIGLANLGHIIENRVIKKALLMELASQSNVTFHLGTPLKAIESGYTGYKIITADDKRYGCELLIGADGADSWVRRQFCWPTFIRSYGHDAIVATVQTRHNHRNTAYQRFLPSGPLAFLPLADDKLCSIVWSVEDSKAESVMTMTDEEFMASLAKAFDHRLGPIDATSKRFKFPLIMRHAQCYVQAGVALIGDAAHTIHPLAGQGVNLGLADAECLANVIAAAIKKGRNFAAEYILRRYERERRPHNELMVQAMSGFKWLFGHDNPVIHWVRNLGLNLTDRLPPVKNRFVFAAMGIDQKSLMV